MQDTTHIVQPNRDRNILLTIAATIGVALLLWLLTSLGSIKLSSALALFAIWGIATVSLNSVSYTHLTLPTKA